MTPVTNTSASHPTSDAAACLEAGQQIAKQSVRFEKISFDDSPAIYPLPVFAIKDGYRVELHPELMPRPARPTGTLVLSNIDSFCRLFKKYKDPDSIIIVDADSEGKRGATYTGILNYHATDKAAHGDFRCQYTAKLSVEWNLWMSKNGKAMGHAEFLEHLDDVRDLIREPDSAGLLDLIGSLEGKVDARFENALNLHNGRMKLSYSEDVAIRGSSQPAGVNKGDMEVPTEIVAGIAPFEFGMAYKVPNKLRYRIQNRTLLFSYEVQKPHVIIMDAVKDQVAKVLELTGAEPLYGSPPTKP